jgi:AraC family transcriptional regulator
MEPRIETLSEKLFVGQNTTMSLASNTTSALWQRFMPGRAEIKNKIGDELYSIEVYDEHHFDHFNVHAEFEKWAAVEVADFTAVPESMRTLRMPAGLYAVFIHKGPASLGPKTYEYIFTTWLPNSDYTLDTRPHFAVMGEKYKANDPNSEEELWIPIRPKTT